MTPGYHDLTYYRGSTDICSVQWKDSAGVAVDLTGYTAELTIRDSSGTIIGETGSGITATITTGSGLVEFTITDNAAAALPAGTHRYDIWVVSSGGIDYPLLYGSFAVIPETR